MYLAYDPEQLTRRVLLNIEAIYTKGCSEGIFDATSNREGVFGKCTEMAIKTVKENEDLYRDRIWNSDDWSVK